MVRPRIGDERREQILSAFERCVIRDGLSKATLQKVAAEADLPRSLVRYFVGNKQDMVGLLIDRMIERAEDSLSRLRPKDRQFSIQDMLDYLFGTVFADRTSNAIVDELWYLAAHDIAIKKRLSKMYARVRDLIANQLHKDGVGGSPSERQATAYALVSLAYGDASFRSLGLKGRAPLPPREIANCLLNPPNNQENVPKETTK